jgi:hypothetical protein
MVNKDSPLLQKRLAERDRARRYRRMCSEAIGPPADIRRERQRLQHQQRQIRYSARIRRALPARVMSNDDSMDIDDIPVHPLPPPAYLPAHQTDAINDFFARLLFTQDEPPECSTCFEKYHGMRMQGTQCDRCHREVLSHSVVHSSLHCFPPTHCPLARIPPLHSIRET